MTSSKYDSPKAFKTAAETKLKSKSTFGAFARNRQLLVFDRFIARVGVVFKENAALKGGLALERRLQHARTTKDVDLCMMGEPSDIEVKLLTQVAQCDLDDFMTFDIRRNLKRPEIENEGLPYGGWCFDVECKLAGMIYGSLFHVDIAFGEPVVGELEQVEVGDDLGVSMKAAHINLIPRETHIAEKLHAYTMPRPTANSRVKDLPDMPLLATVGPLEAKRLREAFEVVFGFRKTHDVPQSFPSPPESWSGPYAKIASDNSLQWSTLDAVTNAARQFLDPVLTTADDATWDRDSWSWRRG